MTVWLGCPRPKQPHESCPVCLDDIGLCALGYGRQDLAAAALASADRERFRAHLDTFEDAIAPARQVLRADEAFEHLSGRAGGDTDRLIDQEHGSPPSSKS